MNEVKAKALELAIAYLAALPEKSKEELSDAEQISSFLMTIAGDFEKRIV